MAKGEVEGMLCWMMVSSWPKREDDGARQDNIWNACCNTCSTLMRIVCLASWLVGSSRRYFFFIEHTRVVAAIWARALGFYLSNMGNTGIFLRDAPLRVSRLFLFCGRFHRSAFYICVILLCAAQSFLCGGATRVLPSRRLRCNWIQSSKFRSIKPNPRTKQRPTSSTESVGCELRVSGEGDTAGFYVSTESERERAALFVCVLRATTSII